LSYVGMVSGTEPNCAPRILAVPRGQKVYGYALTVSRIETAFSPASRTIRSAD